MVPCSLNLPDWTWPSITKSLMNRSLLFKKARNLIALGMMSANSNDVFTLIIFLTSKNNLISLHESRILNFFP